MAEEAAEAKDSAKRDVTNEEMGIAFEGPAIFTNRVFITIGSGGVRIAFTEDRQDALAAFRSAVILPIQSAISLKNILGELLKEHEEQIADMEATAKDDG